MEDIMDEGNKEGMFGGIFNRKKTIPDTGFSQKPTPDVLNAEIELIPEKWYKATWDENEGIAKIIDDNEAEYQSVEFQLRLPDNADPDSVMVSHSVTSDKEDAFGDDFYLIQYRITGAKRGGVKEVFWNHNDGRYIQKFGWYIGDEFEKENNVNQFGTEKPIEF
jgi:hypothetical protein